MPSPKGGRVGRWPVDGLMEADRNWDERDEPGRVNGELG